MKNKTRNAKKSIISGVSRIFDFTGRTNMLVKEQIIWDDKQALQQDWEAVGFDIQNAIDKQK